MSREQRPRGQRLGDDFETNALIANLRPKARSATDTRAQETDGEDKARRERVPEERTSGAQSGAGWPFT